MSVRHDDEDQTMELFTGQNIQQYSGFYLLEDEAKHDKQVIKLHAQKESSQSYQSISQTNERMKPKVNDGSEQFSFNQMMNSFVKDNNKLKNNAPNYAKNLIPSLLRDQG